MINIIKVRDDHSPIQFKQDSTDSAKYSLCDGVECAWLNPNESFSYKELRSRIEPWLTALFQSEHLSLLAGSGLTHAIHYLAADKAATGMNALTLNNFNNEVNQAAKKSSEATGRKKGNLEDQLRVANEL